MLRRPPRIHISHRGATRVSSQERDRFRHDDKGKAQRPDPPRSKFVPVTMIGPAPGLEEIRTALLTTPATFDTVGRAALGIKVIAHRGAADIPTEMYKAFVWVAVPRLRQPPYRHSERDLIKVVVNMAVHHLAHTLPASARSELENFLRANNFSGTVDAHFGRNVPSAAANS